MLKKLSHIKLQKKQLVIGCVVIVVLIGGVIFLLVRKNAHKQKTPIVQQFVLPTPKPVPSQVKELINTVAQKAQLPQGENPSVATVTDVKKLPNSAFFAQAKNGDKVLIYTDAKKAYLYRPSTGEIIQESTVEMADDSPLTASTAAAQAATDAGILRIKY
jgi:hypothetical protein